jgi:uncharacterized protein (DUF302 family)
MLESHVANAREFGNERNRQSHSRGNAWWQSARFNLDYALKALLLRRQTMKDESILIHCEHVSERTFREVITAFEKAVGEITSDTFQRLVAVSSDAHDFETRVRSFEGTSGFMRFLDINHGAWLSRIGLPARCKLYILGNPLIAQTMLEHDLGVGLHVPVRVMIYENPTTGKTRLAYDLPSSLMARLHNEKVTAAARQLDEKLEALAKAVTGVEA